MKEIKLKFNLKINPIVSDEITINVPNSLTISETESYVLDAYYEWLYEKVIVDYEINDEYQNLVINAYNRGYSDEEKYLGTYLYKNTLLQRAYFIGRLDYQSNEKPDNIYNRVVNNPF